MRAYSLLAENSTLAKVALAHPFFSARNSVHGRELKEVGSIDTVHGGPAVQPVAHVCRETLLSRNTDEYRNEAVIAIAMD